MRLLVTSCYYAGNSKRDSLGFNLVKFSFKMNIKGKRLYSNRKYMKLHFQNQYQNAMQIIQ
jgi:hypothetical protein